MVHSEKRELRWNRYLPLQQAILRQLTYVNLTDKFFEQRFVIDCKGVLRKGYALRCNEIAPSFGVCDGCISRRRCQVGVRKIRKNTDRAPKRGRASFGTQAPSVDSTILPPR